MSRRFDGTDDEVRYPVQTVSNFTGAFSVIQIFRFRTLGSAWRSLLSCANSAGTTLTWDVERTDTGSAHFAVLEAVGETTWAMTGGANPPATNTTDWVFWGVSKTAGLTLPRLHYQNLTAGGTMLHLNGSANQNNPTSASGGSIRFGEWRDGDDFDGNLAIDAGWGSVLTDLQFEGLCTNARTQDFLDLHSTVPGAWLHEHTQATATEDILDLFANGHDASGTIAGITTPSGIQGTAMDAVEDPPGWTYYSAAPPPAIMTQYTSAMTAMRPTSIYL